jgi:hypothetical protein
MEAGTPTAGGELAEPLNERRVVLVLCVVEMAWLAGGRLGLTLIL